MKAGKERRRYPTMNLRVETDRTLLNRQTEGPKQSDGMKLIGDTLELYNTDQDFYAALQMGASGKKELFRSLWWSLYHDGEIDVRPTL